MNTIKQKVFNQQMSLLLANTQSSNITNIIAGFLIFYLFYQETATTNLIIWLSVVFTAIALRQFVIQQKIICKTIETCYFYLAASTFLIACAIASIVWLPNIASSLINITTLTILGAGISSGGIFIFSMDRRIQLLYILPFPISIGIRILTSPNESIHSLAYLVIMYIIVILIYGKRTTQELHKNLTLRFKNELLADEMITAKQSAEKANQSKSIFLANMSHEIRTPMNAIIGLTDMMLKTKMDNQQQYLVQNIKQSSNNLLGIINDILDISKIEANELSIENHPFSIEKLLDNIQSNVQQLADDKKLALNINIHLNKQKTLWFIGDDLRLSQVLLNLTSNAIKFSEKGAVSINVDVDAIDNKKSILTFKVIDTGIGISSAHLKTIFSRFQQADSSIVRQYGGSGLGLTISKELVELMGGTLSVNSTVNKGSCFFFSLTLKTYYAKNTSSEKTYLIKKKKFHILLVEDNEMNQLIAETILMNDGHQVTIAENGLIALQKIAEQSFDVVFMDIQMPVMNGYLAAKIIRTSEKFIYTQNEIDSTLSHQLHDKLKGKHIPIFALTAHAMADDQKKCTEVGMDHYLTKPFDTEKIINCLNQI